MIYWSRISGLDASERLLHEHITWEPGRWAQNPGEKDREHAVKEINISECNDHLCGFVLDYWSL